MCWLRSLTFGYVLVMVNLGCDLVTFWLHSSGLLFGYCKLDYDLVTYDTKPVQTCTGLYNGYMDDVCPSWDDQGRP